MDEIVEVLGAIFEGTERPERRDEPAVVYERYLCGGPKELDINDR